VLLKLLMLPVSLPAAGIRYCIEKLVDVAEAELNSVEPIKEELLRLNMALEEGEIDEDAFAAQETVLLARLRQVRERQRAELREEAEEGALEAADGRRVVIDMPDELR
jgi:hypothetical protein